MRWFFGFRQWLPVFQEGIIGAGVCAMNAAGQARFGTWPDALGDDQFVLRLFEPHERTTVSDYRSRSRHRPTWPRWSGAVSGSGEVRPS